MIISVVGAGLTCKHFFKLTLNQLNNHLIIYVITLTQKDKMLQVIQTRLDRVKQMSCLSLLVPLGFKHTLGFYAIFGLDLSFCSQ